MSAALLSGWGRTSPTRATVYRPVSRDGLANALGRSDERGIVARGLGRSYGDPAQNAGGTVVDTTVVASIRTFDPSTGLLSVEAGASLDRLMRLLVPEGWFMPVTPGTRQVTVGGAIAADVHGKNHHRVGSFGDFVESITLVTPARGELLLRRDIEPELFHATIGGMGLTGIILEASIQLKRIETSWLSVDTDRTPDLDSTLALMQESDEQYEYSVAWIDLMASGTAMGRSILDRGDFANTEQLTGSRARTPLAFDPRPPLPAPRRVPSGLINRTTVRGFNEAWFRKAPRRARCQLQSIGQFFHPLDGVAHWNRLYGRRGFLQWQFVVPSQGVEDLRDIVGQLASMANPSFLAVLKRMGPGNDSQMSFPIEGWTLALDVPVADSGLGDTLDRLDERIASIGGRLYLAKDSRMRPELLEQMYPRLREWQQIRREVDAGCVLNSDLARRLRLT